MSQASKAPQASQLSHCTIMWSGLFKQGKPAEGPALLFLSLSLSLAVSLRVAQISTLVCLLPGGEHTASPSTPVAEGTIVSPTSVSVASPASLQPLASEEPTPEEPAEPAEPQAANPKGLELTVVSPLTIIRVGETDLPIVDAAMMQKKNAMNTPEVWGHFRGMDTATNPAWIMLGCYALPNRPVYEPKYKATIRTEHMPQDAQGKAGKLHQGFKGWMAKNAGGIAAATAEGLQWPFVAGVFSEFCHLLSESPAMLPQHPFMMWMKIHGLGQPPAPKDVIEAVGEGLQHCQALLDQLEARLLYFSPIILHKMHPCRGTTLMMALKCLNGTWR